MRSGSDEARAALGEATQARDALAAQMKAAGGSARESVAALAKNVTESTRRWRAELLELRSALRDGGPLVGSRAELAALVGAVRQGLANSTQLLSLAAGTDDGAADDALTQAMPDAATSASATLVGASAQPTEGDLTLREQSTVSLELTAAMRGVLSGDASSTPRCPPRTRRARRARRRRRRS